MKLQQMVLQILPHSNEDPAKGPTLFNVSGVIIKFWFLFHSLLSTTIRDFKEPHPITISKLLQWNAIVMVSLECWNICPTISEGFCTYISGHLKTSSHIQWNLQWSLEAYFLSAMIKIIQISGFNCKKIRFFTKPRKWRGERKQNFRRLGIRGFGETELNGTESESENWVLLGLLCHRGAQPKRK